VRAVENHLAESGAATRGQNRGREWRNTAVGQTVTHLAVSQDSVVVVFVVQLLSASIELGHCQHGPKQTLRIILTVADAGVLGVD
jgi:hypothetical protein